MHHARLTFSGAPHAALSVRKLHIVEPMNDLFSVRLQALSPNESLDLSELVGQKATLQFTWRTERAFRGTCNEARFLRAPSPGEGLATYEFQIVPSLWRLSQRTRCRLFQHRSIPEIVTAIFDEWKIKHALRLDKADYPSLELRAQYHESDYHFVKRLLEEAGISFWFAEEGEEDAVVVLGDRPAANPERPVPLTYVDEAGQAMSAHADFATKLTLTEISRPGTVTLRDHDPMRPRQPLFSSASSGREAESAHEVFRFAPSVSFMETPSSGPSELPVADDLGRSRANEGRAAQASRLQIESLHSDRRVLHLETGTDDLAPGTVFRLLEHPRLDLSPDKTFLSVGFEIVAEGVELSQYVFRCTAVETSKPYRPAAATPKPRMYGVQTAVVVGPGGLAETPSDPGPGGVGTLHGAAMAPGEAESRLTDNEIYVDEMGRVRVQFPWDRDHGFDKQSSIWMRVSQGWGGSGYGLFTIPRVGHEVLVAFLDGDPDCPVVVGRVHNLREAPPFALPANKTVSTFRTATSPGGDGFNELRFDDAAGREHVYLQGQRDMDTLVKNDQKEAVGHDKNRYVQNDDAVAVGRNRTKLVNQNEVDATGLNRVSSVGAHRSTFVGGDDTTFVGARWSVTLARGLGSKLAAEIDKTAGQLGGVMRSAATSVLSTFGENPLTSTAAEALTGFGTAAFSALRDTASFIAGFTAEGGPPPTSIEMQDRQIKLTNGEASIVLDGPHVTIVADGNISFHARGNIAVLGEKEAALAAGGKVGVISDTGDVIVQAQKDVHLNPFVAGGTRPKVAKTGTLGAPPPDPDRCVVCGDPLTAGEQVSSCKRHAKGGGGQ
ncbi:MAG: type VI secretion system tip protein TssI/VgrG [Polyangiaceae bacterium]